MMKRSKGFSLIELLMVLGVMGLLMGMLIPSVGVVREKAQRMATSHKLRQIGLAVATYQSVTARSLTAGSLDDWLSRLATETGVTDGPLFLYEEDPLVAAMTDPVPPSLVARDEAGKWAAIEDFDSLPLSVAVVSGTSLLSNPSTTPVAWTRGLTKEGTWLDHGTKRSGVYGSEGGFIVFLDGHVTFYTDLSADGGRLVRFSDGKQTANISEAIGPGAVVYDYVGKVF